MRKVRSLLPDANWVPSGDQATLSTISVCPPHRVGPVVPVFTSQMRTGRSPPPDANSAPSGDQMRALSRLDSIDAGEILWQGEPIHGDAVPRFRRQAIYLHQRPALIEGTVEENLRLPFTLRIHRQCKFSRERVLSLLGHANRTGAFLQRSSRDLSGGEAQIVALLRAIQLQPTLLLLDEPTAALDDESTQMIEQLVSGWFEESSSERAFVWVSHDKQQVARVAGRVVVMSDGQLSAGVDRCRGQLP